MTGFFKIFRFIHQVTVIFAAPYRLVGSFDNRFLDSVIFNERKRVTKLPPDRSRVIVSRVAKIIRKIIPNNQMYHSKNHTQTVQKSHFTLKKRHFTQNALIFLQMFDKFKVCLLSDQNLSKKCERGRRAMLKTHSTYIYGVVEQWRSMPFSCRKTAAFCPSRCADSGTIGYRIAFSTQINRIELC